MGLRELCFCCSAGFGQVTVTQSKRLVLVRRGGSVLIPCHQSASDYFNMFWYQQKPGQGLTLMVWSTGAKDGKMEGEYGARWHLERNDTHNSELNVTGAEPDDAAQYFCAASSTDTDSGGTAGIEPIGLGDTYRPDWALQLGSCGA
uniref:Ig-like domain-containing protein n=1 Tax=Xenopus tropicalis TaxID=8364 RepID=A0A1B8XZN5_XENTR